MAMRPLGGVNTAGVRFIDRASVMGSGWWLRIASTRRHRLVYAYRLASRRFVLPFSATGAIHRHVTSAQKGKPKSMTIETNDTAAAVAEREATEAPEPDSAKKATSRNSRVPKGRKTAKTAKGGTKPRNRGETNKTAIRARHAKEQRPESKGAKILTLIGRPKGATLNEIMNATDWQAHSIRGLLSTASKRRGLKIDSSKNDAGDRVYKLVS
jgi:hypothetical protein